MISHAKQVFARHGIPDEVICDNMPFGSYRMKQFANEWKFTITTSSPRYAQSNGQAERAIQTVKNLFKKASASNTDVYLALLQYRNTAVTGLDYSPAQLLFSRALNTKLPVCFDKLLSQVCVDAKEQLIRRQRQQKHYYDKGTRTLSQLDQDDVIRVHHDGEWQRGKVVERSNTPRFYVVQTEDGSTLRRNRRHLIRTAEEAPVCAPHIEDLLPAPTEEPEPQHQSTQQPIANPISTRSGRIVKRPVRFNDYDVSIPG